MPDSLTHALHRLELARDRRKPDDASLEHALAEVEMRLRETRPVEYFRRSLAMPADGVRADARWQNLNASINAIRRGLEGQ